MKRNKLIALALSICLIGTLPMAVCAASAGSDIAGHWAQSALQNFIDKGYLKGNGSGRYSPNEPLTEAAFAALLSRVTGLNVAGSSSDAITRQEAVVKVAGLLGLASDETDLTVLNQFSDSGDISDDARQSVAAMVEAGYIHGTDLGTFLPGQALTRAEGVTILNNALGALLAIDADVLYGTATLTFAEFYSGDVSSTAGYGIDGVSSATTSKYSIMSNMYTNFDAETSVDGYNILGVQNVNVAVAAADYQEYLAMNPTFQVTSVVAPAQYKTVAILNGEAVYSATNYNVVDTVTDAAATLKTGSTWGDYEIDIAETSTKYIRNDRTDSWAVNSQIQGVILEGTLGNGQTIKVGMEYLQSIWVQPYEVSFNVSKDSAQNAHIEGWDNLSELSKLVGANITSIIYVMQDGVYVYEFSDGIYIKPAYSGSEVISASFTEGSAEVEISGVPADLKDVTVTITYGSGRQSTTVASAAVIENGKVTMNSEYDSEQTYTVKISSSNYADITAALPMSSAQRTQLTSLAEQAKALIEAGTAANDSGLTEHYEEAVELLENSNATSSEAAELISELTSHLSVYS